MKRFIGLAAIALLLAVTGCGVLSDPGPTLTANEEIDGGKAEAVRTEIRMGAGELRVEGGGTKLLSASFRYSEKIGRPTVQYVQKSFRGQLSVESPKGSTSTGNMVNEWILRMGSEAPLDMNVTLGAGKADLDMSKLPLQSMEVKVGAGELLLNVAGQYKKDVTVNVSGGVGEAKIRLPKDVGVVVDATGGIGSINIKGLTKRDGKYYNEAFSEDKPAVRMVVRGGVGEISLNVEE